MARVTLRLARNDISPRLSGLARAARRAEPVFRAMANVFKSMTEGNFNSAGAQLRPRPWPPKKDGSESNLKRSGLLWHSFHLTVTDQGATLSNPTPYAAVHQFGSGKVDAARGADGRPMNIPARPFYPVDEDGRLTPAAFAGMRDAGLRALAR